MKEMVLWKGRLLLRKYVKNKPNKYDLVGKVTKKR